MKSDQIAVSPCSNPELDLEAALTAYAQLGYRHFEMFTSWTQSAADFRQPAHRYLEMGRRHGITFTSLHLPPIDPERFDETLKDAVAAAQFAAAIGVEVVLYKAKDRPTYVRGAAPFLQATQDLCLTPVIQNHYGTALTTLADVTEVLRAIQNPRMRALLEVGHFHSAGVHWRTAAEQLGTAVALVHIKDQIGRQSVPFGRGEIDLPGLFRHMDGQAYTGRYVVEMEVEDRDHTLGYLAEARTLVLQHCTEENIRG